MQSRKVNKIVNGLEIFILSASLNCLYSARPKINYPIEVKEQQGRNVVYYKFDKIGNTLYFITPIEWWVDKNYKEGEISFDEFKGSREGYITRDDSNESLFIKAEQEARELLKKALNK